MTPVEIDGAWEGEPTLVDPLAYERVTLPYLPAERVELGLPDEDTEGGDDDTGE